MHITKENMNVNFNSLLSLLSIVIIVNVGCAKTLQAHRIPSGQLESNAARVYIFRPSPVGLLVKARIYENNNLAGQIGSGGYLVWDTKAGDITLQGGSGFVKIEAQPGKTYYFKLQPKCCSTKSDGFSFILLSEQEAKSYLAKLKEPKVKVVS